MNVGSSASSVSAYSALRTVVEQVSHTLPTLPRLARRSKLPLLQSVAGVGRVWPFAAIPILTACVPFCFVLFKISRC
jgi:hypothetical protein